MYLCDRSALTSRLRPKASSSTARLNKLAPTSCGSAPPALEELDACMKYWINSVPLPSCALVNGVEDLHDGRVVSDLASFVLGKNFSRPNTFSSSHNFCDAGLIRSVIVSLATACSWKHVPDVLRLADAPEKIAAGHRGIAITLVKFIKDVWDIQQQTSAGPSAPPPVCVEAINSAPSPSYSMKAFSALSSHHVSLPQLYCDDGSSESSSMESNPSRGVNSARFHGSNKKTDEVNEKSINENCSVQINYRMPPISAACRADIILWLESIGVVSASSARRRSVHSSAHAACRHEHMDPLSDPWCNGVLLSELAAVLCKNGAKTLVKEILPVCSCKNSSAHNIISSVGSIPRTGPRGVLTAPAGGACAVHDSSCVRPPQQPRMMLVGTEVNVKSVAQVLQNLRVALATLSSPNATGLNKAILLPDTYSSKENINVIASRDRSRSVTTHRLAQSGEIVPDADLAAANTLDCSAEDLCSGKVSIWDILSTLYQATGGHRPTAIHRNDRARSVSPHTRNRAVQRSRSPQRSRSADARARRHRVRFEDEVDEGPEKRTPSYSSSVSRRETTSSSSGSASTEVDGESLPVKVPKQVPASRLDDTSLNSKPPHDFSQLLSKTIDHVVPIAPAPNKASRVNRMMTDTNNIQMPNQDYLDYFPPITRQQQEAIRLWLMGLGLDVKDGCGGYYSSQQRVALDTLSPSIAQDRLRNGLLFCDIAMVLEPNASAHTNIPQLARQTPKTLNDARSIIRSALLFFQVRKSPPIPETYFKNVDCILRGLKDALWGLLWEIMQAYPSSFSPSVPIGNELFTHANVSECCKNRNARDRKKAAEIFQWIRSCIQLPELPVDVQPFDSLVSLESVIRDGTLLCELGKEVLHIPMHVWCRKPRSYSQCLANVKKAIMAFQTFAASKRVHLANRSDVEIVKGNWGEILSLLYDVCQLHQGGGKQINHCLDENVSDDITPQEDVQVNDLAPLPNIDVEESLPDKHPEDDFAAPRNLSMVCEHPQPESISQRLVKEVDAAMKTSTKSPNPAPIGPLNSNDLVVRGKVDIGHMNSLNSVRRLPIADAHSAMHRSVAPSSSSSPRVQTPSQPWRPGPSPPQPQKTSSPKKQEFGAALECLMPKDMVTKINKVSSWLIDIGVDVRPLQELLSVVRRGSRPGEPSDCIFGYVAPLPSRKPKKDLSTLLCEAIFQLWRRSLIIVPTDSAVPSHVGSAESAISVPPGCTSLPRSPAQRRQNVRRALSMLAANNKIPVRELMCEDEILLGNVDSVIRLLSIVRTCYCKENNK